MAYVLFGSHKIDVSLEEAKAFRSTLLDGEIGGIALAQVKTGVWLRITDSVPVAVIESPDVEPATVHVF